MLLPEYNFDSKVKRLCERLKNICLKSVPGNQIVASVKIKIATVESPLPLSPHKKKILAGDLTQKKNPVEAVDAKKILQAEKVPPPPPSLF